MLLEMGVERVTTLEYNPIVTDHPRLTVVTPEELNEIVSQLIHSYTIAIQKYILYNSLMLALDYNKNSHPWLFLFIRGMLQLNKF